MNIINIITNFFSEFHAAYTLPFAVKLAAAVIACIVLWIKKPRWRNAGYAVVFIVLVRLALFDNPYIWGHHFTKLETDDVGWRQQSALGVEYYKFFKITKPKQYLAVGSSQTYAIYMPYSKDHSDLIVFNLSGMTPLDMFFYRKYIVERKPEYILLFLSEFDLAKIPNLDAVKIGPSQGLGLLRELPVLYGILKLAPPSIALYEIMVGELLTEYKFSFIFRGYLDKWTAKRPALKIKSKLDDLNPDANQIADAVSDLVKDLDRKWIPFNAYFLEKFLGYCQDHGIKIIIAEGQYNPSAYTDKTLELNRIARQELERIDRSFDAVTFLPREQTLTFTEEDYQDSVHVKAESGVRYAGDLIKRIGSQYKPELPAQNP